MKFEFKVWNAKKEVYEDNSKDYVLSSNGILYLFEGDENSYSFGVVKPHYQVHIFINGERIE